MDGRRQWEHAKPEFEQQRQHGNLSERQEENVSGGTSIGHRTRARQAVDSREDEEKGEEDEEARRRKTVRFLKNIEREEKLKNSWSQGESKSGRGEAHVGGSEKGARQRPGRRIMGPIARLTRLLQGIRKAVSGWEDDCARLCWFQTDSERGRGGANEIFYHPV